MDDAASDDTGVFARESSRLGRAVQIGLASGRVISVSFPETVPPDAGSDHPVLDALFAYLDGERDDLPDVEVALTVPTDRRRVLEAVGAIPAGETATVEAVVRMADLDPEDETDREIATAALAENPVPLLVPDHRIEGVRGATPADVAERLRALET
ncbi:MAG: MGMT family protein [Haloferacaceae archaeon]